MLQAALRKPSDIAVVAAFQALFPAEKLWASFRVPAPGGYVEAGLHSRVLAPRELEALQRITHKDLELLQAVGASAAPFLLTSKAQTIAFASSAVGGLIGGDPSSVASRKLAALFVSSMNFDSNAAVAAPALNILHPSHRFDVQAKTPNAETTRAIDSAYKDGRGCRVAVHCRHAREPSVGAWCVECCRISFAL